MGWREILKAPAQDFSDFSYKSLNDEDFSSFCNLNPEDLDKELRFEWMERAAIMEYDGGCTTRRGREKSIGTNQTII